MNCYKLFKVCLCSQCCSGILNWRYLSTSFDCLNRIGHEVGRLNIMEYTIEILCRIITKKLMFSILGPLIKFNTCLKNWVVCFLFWYHLPLACYVTTFFLHYLCSHVFYRNSRDTFVLALKHYVQINWDKGFIPHIDLDKGLHVIAYFSRKKLSPNMACCLNVVHKPKILM